MRDGTSFVEVVKTAGEAFASFLSLINPINKLEVKRMKQYGAEFFGTFWLVSRRMRQRSARGCIPQRGHRLARCVPRVRSHSPDDSVRHRSRIRWSPQPCRIRRPAGRRSIPIESAVALRRRPSARWGGRRGCPLRNCQWQGRFRPLGWIRLEWLRRPFARRLLPGGGLVAKM